MFRVHIDHTPKRPTLSKVLIAKSIWISRTQSKSREFNLRSKHRIHCTKPISVFRPPTCTLCISHELHLNSTNSTQAPRPRHGAVVAKLDDSTAIVFGGWSWLEMGDVHFMRLVGCNDVETGTLQRTATHCNILQRNSLQHTATRGWKWVMCTLCDLFVVMMLRLVRCNAH